MIQLGLIAEKVYPSAGHHDKDSGAIANGYKEADVVKMIRNLMIEDLKKRNHPYNTDEDWENNRTYQNRIRKEIRAGDSLADIHMDAGPETASGITVYISKNAGKASKLMAKETLEGLVKITGLSSRGVRTENQSQHKRIGILNLKGSAMLIELGFITNKGDLKAILDNKEKIAVFINDMLIKYDKNK